MSDKIKILIVEDEIMIAEDIAMRLEDMGYEVADKIDNVDEAVEWLEQNQTDILLVDISLQGDKTGLDLAAIINERFHLPFVFLSSLANNTTVEKARQVQPAAYLLKPFNDRQVKVSVDMALHNFYGKKKTQEPETVSEPESLPQDVVLRMPQCLFLKKHTCYHKVPFTEILWLEAESNYTLIHTKGETYTYSLVLKSFEEKLPSETFVRVHRSFIVNISNITGIDGNTLLFGKNHVPVAKSVRDDLFNKLNII
ncbi:LytR/AlgR family response regulator transcription factor [Marinilabilia sp.]